DGWVEELTIQNPLRILPRHQPYPSLFFTSSLKSLTITETAYLPSLNIEKSISSSTSLTQLILKLSTQGNCDLSGMRDAISSLQDLEELELEVQDYMDRKEPGISATFLEPIVAYCTQLRRLKIQSSFLAGLRKGTGAMSRLEVSCDRMGLMEAEEVTLENLRISGMNVICQTL
ncbi:hypothetical protein BT69DRAFT_1330632, partial [Atractiella rhizophila]